MNAGTSGISGIAIDAVVREDTFPLSVFGNRRHDSVAFSATKYANYCSLLERNIAPSSPQSGS
ncbi:hypothetical protein [Neorhizobium galegae]|uniref:hypothetical protein n=1 Tax=Neorhizobium galegae TaxID=399 RepID=UPI0012D4CEC8|nr:hypothetical protein [Neorhizobium galegae]KAB1124714.1 hypothetical protein F4V90_14125 [Neorhizobium galegae]MCQ1806434.1 hypothetical protein [Neorhizobium galegae]